VHVCIYVCARVCVHVCVCVYVFQDKFVSREGKSKHQLWQELCLLISKNPIKVRDGERETY